jgi:hypothetical protein
VQVSVALSLDLTPFRPCLVSTLALPLPASVHCPVPPTHPSQLLVSPTSQPLIVQGHLHNDFVVWATHRYALLSLSIPLQYSPFASPLLGSLSLRPPCRRWFPRHTNLYPREPHMPRFRGSGDRTPNLHSHRYVVLLYFHSLTHLLPLVLFTNPL